MTASEPNVTGRPKKEEEKSRHDGETCKTSREQSRLRAINRAPVIIQKLYDRDLLGVDLAAKFGPKLPEVKPDDSDEARRQLTPEQQRQQREARNKRISEKKAQGMSSRAIAAEEGVSKSVVDEVSNNSTVRDRTVEHSYAQSQEVPKVQGLDGKRRPARRLTPDVTARPSTATQDGRPARGRRRHAVKAFARPGTAGARSVSSLRR